MVVSSVTPLICSAMPCQSLGSSARRAPSTSRTHPELLGVGRRSARAPCRRARTRRPCARAGWRRRRRRGSCWGPRRRASAAPARCTTSTPRASRPSRRTPGRPWGRRAVPLGADGDGRGGVVLGREDVAARPADLGAERGQGLDEHRGLDGHVQRAGDAGAGQRLAVGVLGAQRHEAGHLVLGEADLLAAELGQRQVGDAGTAGRRCPGSAPTVIPWWT